MKLLPLIESKENVCPSHETSECLEFRFPLTPGETSVVPTVPVAQHPLHGLGFQAVTKTLWRVETVPTAPSFGWEAENPEHVKQCARGNVRV